MGTWCHGSSHLLDVTPCLDAVAMLLHTSVDWSPSDAGVETDVEYEGEQLLLQIRPRLFFITESDVKLFG